MSKYSQHQFDADELGLHRVKGGGVLKVDEGDANSSIMILEASIMIRQVENL